MAKYLIVLTLALFGGLSAFGQEITLGPEIASGSGGAVLSWGSRVYLSEGKCIRYSGGGGAVMSWSHQEEIDMSNCRYLAKVGRCKPASFFVKGAFGNVSGSYLYLTRDEFCRCSATVGGNGAVLFSSSVYSLDPKYCKGGARSSIPKAE